MPSSFIPFDIENDVVITTDSIKQTKDDKYNNKESSINHSLILFRVRHLNCVICFISLGA